jgi:hypothetical protein
MAHTVHADGSGDDDAFAFRYLPAAHATHDVCPMAA